MASSQKRSHRNSVENGSIDKFTAGTATVFMTISVVMSWGPKVDPDPKNVVVTKAFAPKFRSEPYDREVPRSHGDYFRDNFCDCDSEPLSGNFQSTFGQLPDTS